MSDTTSGPASLQPNRADIETFVKLLFPYADSDTYASLRGFPQAKSGGPAVFIRPVHINGSLDPLIEAAFNAAFEAANAKQPVVFAPPVCTFSSAERARTADLANGVSISVEIDEGDTIAAWQHLEGLLGKVTMAVASGGEWID